MIYTFEQIQTLLNTLNHNTHCDRDKTLVYQSYGKYGGVFKVEIYFAKYADRFELRVLEEIKK